MFFLISSRIVANVFILKSHACWQMICDSWRFIRCFVLRSFLKRKKSLSVFVNSSFLRSWLNWVSSFYICINKRNFSRSVMINWFKRVWKSLKKSCVSWRRNRISSLLWMIVLLTCWFLRLMWMLFFLCCLTISD